MAAGPDPRRQTSHVADYTRTLTWEDFPAGVRSQAIRCVLDLCGAAVAGSRTEAAQTAAAYALYAHGTGPSTIIGTPRTTEEAQFSLPWPVACALIDGVVGPEQVAGESLADPVRRELAALVEVVVDAELEEAFPEQALAWVEIETTDGSHARSGIFSAPGDAHSPFSDTELAEKFSDLTEPVLGSQRARKLASAIDKLPDSPNLDEITVLLRCATSPDAGVQQS